MGRVSRAAFRDGDDVDIRSRNQLPLARYFPELVDGLRRLPVERVVLDGEIVAVADGRPDLVALLARLHPAESRVARLSEETPALFITFDMLEIEGEDLRDRRFSQRRGKLEGVLAAARPPILLTPLTDDRAEAERWLASYQGAGVDGVVAKHHELRYEPGARRMVKVKRERTADCVVAGALWYVDQALPSSLLLGLYADDGNLRHVGVASSFTQAARRRLLEEIEPYVVPLECHPWKDGFLLGRGPTPAVDPGGLLGQP